MAPKAAGGSPGVLKKSSFGKFDFIKDRVINADGHEYKANVLSIMAIKDACVHCDARIIDWIESESGLKCRFCKINIHTRCYKFYALKCKSHQIDSSHNKNNLGKEIDSLDVRTTAPHQCTEILKTKLENQSNKQNGNTNEPHRWQSLGFGIRNGFCSHCGSNLLFSGSKANQCAKCNLMAHKNCIPKMLDICGLDLKERRGRIEIEFTGVSSQNERRGKCVNVGIKNCRNLQIMDANMKADPYCKVAIIHRGEVIKKLGKSKIIYGDRNPNFDYNISVFDSDFKKRTSRLLVSVSDYDTFSRNDFMGCLSFGYADLFALDSSPPLLVDSIHTYRLDSRKRGQATHCRIEVCDDLEIPSASSSDQIESNIDLRRKLFDNLKSFTYISEGSFGTVFKANLQLKKSTETLAVKIIPKSCIKTWDEVADIKFEKMIGKRLARLGNHDRFIYLHSATQTREFFLFLMPYSPLTLDDLKSMIFDDIGMFRFVVSRIMPSLIALREELIIHRDIKPENILLDQQARFKLCDFGVSRIFSGGTPDKHCVCVSIVGSPIFMAPEIWREGLKYSFEVDLWSFGVMMYNLYTQKVFILTALLDDNRQSISEDCDQNGIKRFMRRRLSVYMHPEFQPIVKQFFLAFLEIDSEKRSTVYSNYLSLPIFDCTDEPHLDDFERLLKPKMKKLVDKRDKERESLFHTAEGREKPKMPNMFSNIKETLGYVGKNKEKSRNFKRFKSAIQHIEDFDFFNEDMRQKLQL